MYRCGKLPMSWGSPTARLGFGFTVCGRVSENWQSSICVVSSQMRDTSCRSSSVVPAYSSRLRRPIKRRRSMAGFEDRGIDDLMSAVGREIELADDELVYQGERLLFLLAHDLWTGLHSEQRSR